MKWLQECVLGEKTTTHWLSGNSFPRLLGHMWSGSLTRPGVFLWQSWRLRLPFIPTFYYDKWWIKDNDRVSRPYDDFSPQVKSLSPQWRSMCAQADGLCFIYHTIPVYLFWSRVISHKRVILWACCIWAFIQHSLVGGQCVEIILYKSSTSIQQIQLYPDQDTQRCHSVPATFNRLQICQRTIFRNNSLPPS